MSNDEDHPTIPPAQKLKKNRNKNKNVEINNVSKNTNNLDIPLMRIPISIFNINTQALVDTGAAASFISLELLTRLPNEKLKEDESFNALIFKTVSGETIKFKSKYKSLIEISKKGE